MAWAELKSGLSGTPASAARISQDDAAGVART